MSVIVPFIGSASDLDALADRLTALSRRPDDELIVADNRPGASCPEIRGPVRIHPANAIGSAGFARNRGAALATRDWLVFIDADTDPRHDLLDAYFRPAPAEATAILAGAIVDVTAEPAPSLSARHAVARGHMSQNVTLDRQRHPYAQSANLAVRRDAFIAIGGFDEHIRAAEDADLCIRLAATGRGLESRPEAVVAHHARGRLGPALAQLVGHGAGAAWCERRHPGSFPRPGLGHLSRRLGHSLRGAAAGLLAGDREQASFALLEIAETLAFELGRLTPNQPRWRRRA